MSDEISRAAVERAIVGILANLKDVSPDDIVLGDNDDFLRVLDLDSIDAVELTACLDASFDVRFGAAPDDLDRLACFGSIVDLVLDRGCLDARL